MGGSVLFLVLESLEKVRFALWCCVHLAAGLFCSMFQIDPKHTKIFSLFLFVIQPIRVVHVRLRYGSTPTSRIANDHRTHVAIAIKTAVVQQSATHYCTRPHTGNLDSSTQYLVQLKHLLRLILQDDFSHLRPDQEPYYQSMYLGQNANITLGQDEVL